MRRRLSLLLLTAAACLLAAGRAEACTCSRPASPCAAYAGAGAVFVGTVADARGAKAGGKGWAGTTARRVYKFAVEEAFSGVVGAEVEVWTGAGGGDCGFPFERGARYVVYAQRDDETGSLSTSICTRTQTASAAAEDLEFLRGLAARASGGTLSGEVTRVRKQIKEGSWRGVGPAADAPVLVYGEGLRRELHTDAQGRFSLSGLKPGTYRVKLSPPENLVTHEAERRFEVADRGCAAANFFVFDDGRLGGVITDAEGKPAGNVRLTLYEADDPDPAGLDVLSLHTDAEGRYLFEGVPPGSYRLAVNLTRLPDFRDQTAAFPRTYYPGTPEASGAEVITLGEGERKLNLDWRLPARRPSVPVEVFVVWPDGRPVEKALVTLQDVTYGSEHRHGDETDADGRVAFEGFEGQTLVVEAHVRGSSADGEAATEHSEPLRVTLSNPLAPIRLVIRGPR